MRKDFAPKKLGRPRLPEEKRLVSVRLWLPPALLASLEATAEKLGIERADVGRAAVSFALSPAPGTRMPRIEKVLQSKDAA